MKKNQITAFIEKAKEGNQIAYTNLHKHYKNQVYYFVLKQTNNDTIAKDVTNETFFKAFTKIATYSSNYEFKTWLITIAKNEFLNSKRKKNTFTTTDNNCIEYELLFNIVDLSQSIDDDEELVSSENRKRLKQIIKRLKPKYQKMIQLRYYDEKSYQEIAEELNIPSNTVRVNLHRVINSMAKMIKAKN